MPGRVRSTATCANMRTVQRAAPGEGRSYNAPAKTPRRWRWASPDRSGRHKVVSTTRGSARGLPRSRAACTVAQCGYGAVQGTPPKVLTNPPPVNGAGTVAEPLGLEVFLPEMNATTAPTS
jgi:hypothetical protein